MKIEKGTKFLIVGLGVIGGGYAKALTKAGYTVDAFTKKASDVLYAKEHGICRKVTTIVDKKMVEEADMIIFALYPHTFIDWVKEYGHLIQPKTLVTDVTGVKTEVIEKVNALLPRGVEFIAAHPMAGRESSGIEYSDDEVFHGANYIITPTIKNSTEAICACRDLGKILGFAKISILSPAEHDRMVAYLSQLTHVIAVVLMNAENIEGLEKYTGDSFRDLTRIAKINDAMWSELFLMNREALLSEMDDFLSVMEKFRALLVAGDREGMRAMMRVGTARRSLFDKPKKGEAKTPAAK
ncbi:MAG TPA: prephenate dehydrogenase/arogenate dehydrogenase family protein [Clostridiales bacterium]|nr:prephenate dehydrogenase/arogenate dehydrogenase family protein [Clostridiales bacterium]